MLRYRVKGDWKKTENFLDRIRGKEHYKNLNAYAQKGVDALMANTPVDSGLTASSWSYEIENSHGNVSIVWLNSNINEGVNIAIILQCGHGTGTGGYVAGRDYINPALQPVFDEIADAVWKEVTSNG